MPEDRKPTEVERLFSIVEALDAENRQENEDAPSNEDLSTARQDLAAHLKAVAEGENPDLESARALRSAIERIDGEFATRKEAREAAQAEAKKLLEGIDLENQDEGDGDESEGDGDEKDGEGDGEGEGSPPATEKVGEALKAALKKSSARSEEKVRVEEETRKTDVLVSAVGVAQGVRLKPNATLDDAADLFSQFAPHVKRGQGVIIHMDKMYPEERALGKSATENARRIDAVMSPRAITAAGGICDPLPADFTHPICGDRGRPIRDQALESFRADRGGVRFPPSATVADLESAITVWTAATDETPGTATKDCPRVNCEEEDTATTDAIVACLTVGNFQSRFNPEFWRSRLDLLMVAHDRIAEQTLFATMLAGSTATTYATDNGTIVNLLQTADKAVAGIRSRHRLLGTRFKFVAPAWTRDALRAHLASQNPNGGTDLYALADATLNTFFTSRGIDPVWSPDLDEFGAQGAGALLDFPGGDVQYLLYPVGSWMFLDGGTLDLGTQITDSTLNATNDRQAFMETFEQAVFRGCESLAVTVNVGEDCICPAGS